MDNHNSFPKIETDFRIRKEDDSEAKRKHLKIMTAFLHMALTSPGLCAIMNSYFTLIVIYAEIDKILCRMSALRCDSVPAVRSALSFLRGKTGILRELPPDSSAVTHLRFGSMASRKREPQDIERKEYDFRRKT